MPICPNCCGNLKKRKNSQGKYWHCTRHGFVRDIGTPEQSAPMSMEQVKTALTVTPNYQSKRLKMSI